MAKLKKNFFYNLLLTVSGYIFPLLTFPYISRVLGVEGVGLVNFAKSLVDYSLLFANLGIAIVGLREIAQANTDVEKRNKTFSSLMSLHMTLSAIVLLIYILCIISVPSLCRDKTLYLIGGTKIIFNVFLVEWLFQGLQDFKYITIRTLITRIIYVIAIFLFVRTKDDYIVYFAITIAQVALNSAINWRYAKNNVKFHFTLKNTNIYIKPILYWGINMMLLSFYSTITIMYLGFSCGNKAVGYYTTATRLYTIILSVLNAYNSVFIPYLNSVYAKGDKNEFLSTISKSFTIVTTLSIPLIAFCFIVSPQIISIIAGAGYENAIVPFRIILFQIFLVGVSQITNCQILLPLKKDKELFISTLAGAVVMLILLLLFVKSYAEVAASYAVLISHIVEFCFLYYFAKKHLDIKIPFKDWGITCLATLPIIGITCLSTYYLTNDFFALIISGLLSFGIYFAIQYYFIKNQLVITYINNFLRWFSKK